MRKKELKLVVTFHTTADAMAMEKACKEHGVPGGLHNAHQVFAHNGIQGGNDVVHLVPGAAQNLEALFPESQRGLPGSDLCPVMPVGDDQISAEHFQKHLAYIGLAGAGVITQCGSAGVVFFVFFLQEHHIAPNDAMAAFSGQFFLNSVQEIAQSNAIFCIVLQGVGLVTAQVEVAALAAKLHQFSADIF